MSFYLTYRPQTIDELDLVKVREQLLTILSSGSVSHAYLFAGPKGTGKTSSARIVSKVLNCEENKAVFSGKRKKLKEPCNSCEMCRRITAGSSLAVVEMDAASNRGIDDIRELRERVGLAPSEGRFTCYVIDEVHMLTNEAFNALLKTLEEPPAHAVFFLCTTEAHKIPDTVISRCQKVSYYKANEQEVIRSLSKAVEGESLDVEDGVLAAIAGRVDGSFRDGMKILEQLSNLGGAITTEMVDELTGFSDEYDPRPFIKALIQKDAKAAFDVLEDKHEQGISISLYGDRVIESLRKLLKRSVLEGENIMGRGDLVSLLEMTVHAMDLSKQIPIDGLFLEVVVAKWCEGGVSQGSSVDEERPVQPMSRKATAVVKKNQKNRLITKSSKQLHKISSRTDSDVPSGDVNLDDADIQIHDIHARWQDILGMVKAHNHGLEALLKSATPTASHKGLVTLAVSYNFHKEQLMQDRHSRVLENIFAQTFGGKVRFLFELSDSVATAEARESNVVVENVTGSVADEALAEAAEEIFGA